MIFAPKTALLPVLALLAACQPAAPPTAAPADPARAAVLTAKTSLIERHDSLMTLAGRLQTLKEQLAPRPNAAPYLRGLTAADQAMMTWMNRYAPDTTRPAAAQLAYLQAQQAQLAAVETRMHAALDSARAFGAGQ